MQFVVALVLLSHHTVDLVIVEEVSVALASSGEVAVGPSRVDDGGVADSEQTSDDAAVVVGDDLDVAAGSDEEWVLHSLGVVVAADLHAAVVGDGCRVSAD